MAFNDVKVVTPAGISALPTVRWQTEAAATAILAGEPVKLKVAGSPYVIPLADAEPVVGTTTAVVGVTQCASTQTSALDGYVDVYVPLPGVQYAARAKTTSTFDTLAEINALRGDRVVFDLTSGVFTVDVAAGDGSNNGLMIINGVASSATCYFTIRDSATYLN